VRVLDVSECREFARVSAAQPPGILHLMLLSGALLVASAVGWCTWTRIDERVVGTGRVRSLLAPASAFEDATGWRAHAESAGCVAAVVKREGERVVEGELLVQLDARDLQQQLAEEAEILCGEQDRLRALHGSAPTLEAEFRAEREELEAELELHLADLAKAQERRRIERERLSGELTLEEALVGRLEKAASAGAVRQTEYEDALRRRDALRADALRVEILPIGDRREVLQRRIAGCELRRARTHEQLEQDIAEQELEIKKLEGRTRQLERELAQRSIRSPSAGLVSSLEVARGDYVAPGQLVATVVAGTDLRMDALIAAQDAGRIAVGMPARIKLAAFDFRRFGTLDGEVTSISSDSEVLPDGRIGYTIQVRLLTRELKKGEHRGEARIGMTGTVELIAGRQRVIDLLLRGFST